MKRIHPIALTLRLVSLCAAALFTGPSYFCLPARAQSPLAAKIAGGGAFKDSAGTTHAWQINSAHTLVWDNAPYLPAGGAFTPRSLSQEGMAAWQDDVRALETLKAHGIRDIILTPERSVPDISQADFQRLIDYLDANDFRYGLGFGPGIAKPLVGIVVRPTVYRYYEKDGLTATWQVSNTDGGLYAIVDADNGNKLMRGDYVQVTSSVVTLPIEVPSNVVGRMYAQFYPHKTLTGENTLPDLWSGFDTYRDRTLAFFAKAKFGKGLRFFLDPLAPHLGLSGETDYAIPDSTAFRLEWEAFITQRYGSVDRARDAWQIAESDFKSLHDMANLVPLWEKTHGIPYFFDGATGAKIRLVDAGKSHWWGDFLEYRDNAIQYSMNTMADLLKEHVANVPVVYTWTQSHPIFLNRQRSGGFDGLSIPARGAGNSLLIRTLAPAYSHVEQADRALWCLATEISDVAAAPAAASGSTVRPVSDTPPAAAPAQPSGGFVSAQALGQCFDSARRVGAKAFFVDDLRGGRTAQGDWVDAPASLDWIRDWGGKWSSEPAAARYTPRVLYFPQNTPGPARSGPIPGSSALWLSAYVPGETLDYWPAYSGYRIQYGVGNIETVLVSLQGKRETHLWVTDPKSVQAFTADGASVPVKILGKTEVAVTLDSAPIVFRAGDQHLVIQEAAEDAIQQLDALYDVAEARKIPEIQSVRTFVDKIRRNYANKDFENAYVLAASRLNELMALVRPYLWIEGERPGRVNTFDEVARNPEASGDHFLNLSNHNAPPQKYEKYGYGVYYDLDVPKEGTYNIWLAGSLPGPGVSPIVWRIDNPPDMNVADPSAHGPRWLGDRFGWMLMGAMKLTQGAHTLSIFVPERAVAPALYNFSIDAIMVTQGNFQPNGTIRPVPVDAATIRAQKAKKREKRPDPPSRIPYDK